MGKLFYQSFQAGHVQATFSWDDPLALIQGLESFHLHLDKRGLLFFSTTMRGWHTSEDLLASLPLRFGGLGIRTVVDIQSFASWADALMMTWKRRSCGNYNGVEALVDGLR